MSRSGNFVRFGAPEGSLTPAMRSAYERDGFLVLEGFASEEECATLVARTDALIESFNPSEARSVFDSAGQRHGGDLYFRESGDKIRFFLEPGAVDAKGDLTVPKTKAINKIGHALHVHDPVFSPLSGGERLMTVARGIGFRRPIPVQSMLILKQPHIGDEVGWHQDATYLYTDPVTVTGFWLALEDATRHNGCLLALAGAHRGSLRRRYRERDGSLVMEYLDGTPWPDIQPVAIEARRGTLIVLHGLLPHASGANKSARSRYAYAVHAVESDAHYPADNWLRRSDRG